MSGWRLAALAVGVIAAAGCARKHAAPAPAAPPRPPLTTWPQGTTEPLRITDALVLMGSELPFPFRARPSRLILPGIPDGTIACMPLLDEWGVPSRLASRCDFPGCFCGFVTELADAWLASLRERELAEVEIFACGPTPMLEATAKLARRVGVPCQVSLEEFMACAVGGCAGCTVPVRTADGPAMKRVCVDGPVFDAATVF